jgi:importin-9
MEQQVLQLLEATTSPNSEAIRNAEHSLKSLYSSTEFPFALLTIASHNNIALGLRQAALLQIKQYVSATWSSTFEDDFKGTIYLNDEAKARLRQAVFVLATNEGVDGAIDHKINTAAASVASKIANADFPESWPDLLPHLLQIITGSGPDIQVHGALRVLSELVDSGFSEEHFFAAARDLVSGLQNVANNTNRNPTVRAMAMSVFRACFDMLEMVMEDHKVAVKGFLDESLQSWMPFFVDTIKSPLPNAPSKDDDTKGNGPMSLWRGSIALKLQVVKVRNCDYAKTFLD